MIIYKYELSPGASEVEIPFPATFLHADTVGEHVYMWISHNELVLDRPRSVNFMVVPTGVGFNTGLSYYKTVLMGGGGLVFHVYGENVLLPEPKKHYHMLETIG